MHKKTVKPTGVTLPDGAWVELGSLVGYYHGGWRTGTLESIAGSELKIRPIPPHGGGQRNLVTVSTNDLKQV